MLTIPDRLAADLADGATFLAWAWRLRLADGRTLGFTDHDRDLVADGVRYVAASARQEGATEAETGFASGSAALAGVLDHDTIDEAAIAAGRFDDAELTLLRIDWRDPSVSTPVFSGRIGEVRRGRTGFVAELRGPGAALERTIGRTISRRCDAELGDARCGVDLGSTAYRAVGVVSSIVSQRRFVASGLALSDGWLTAGALTWTAGANAGDRARVLDQRSGADEAVIELLETPARSVSVGDAFAAEAGCDKRWRTCRDRFSNLLNFRGFPMIPGDDWALSAIREGERADGSSIWLDDAT